MDRRTFLNSLAYRAARRPFHRWGAAGGHGAKSLVPSTCPEWLLSIGLKGRERRRGAQGPLPSGGAAVISRAAYGRETVAASLPLEDDTEKVPAVEEA